MSRFRCVRALLVLALVIGQGALGLPHRMMGQAAPAHAQAGTMAEHCQHMAGAPAHSEQASSHSDAPAAPCACCHGSVPGSAGNGCPDMAGCAGPAPLAPVSAPAQVLALIHTSVVAPVVSAPAAHELVPEPPPPRA